MSSRIHRTSDDFKQGADSILSQQLAIYKTPATIQELIVAPFYVEIRAPTRPLFSRIIDGVVQPASTTNKHYLHFAEPAIAEFPWGFQNTKPNEPTTIQNWFPLGAPSDGTVKAIINKQKSLFPYQSNVSKYDGSQEGIYGDLSQGAFPTAALNPPEGNAPNTIYPPGSAQVVGIPAPEKKFYPLIAKYDPPTPFPPTSTWYAGQFTGPSLVFTAPSNVKTQLTLSSLTEIYDLLGTEIEIDLQEQFNKLNNIKVSSDKIAWELTIESVQVQSDGRTLASARFINNGLEKMKNYILNPYEPDYEVQKEQWGQVNTPQSNTELENLLYNNTGFGYQVTHQPRPIISQPISIGFPELSCSSNDQVQFVVNSNEGYSLDKGAGSIIKFGKFPWSKLKMQYGNYLDKPVGDTTAVENEATSGRKFYDLNNEIFADRLSGGSIQPVFYNQQIGKLAIRFTIKLIVLF